MIGDFYLNTYQLHELKFRLEEFWDDFINNYRWSEYRYLVRKVIRFPLRVWKWKSIIFHDENWDYHYLVKVMEFKLKDLEKALREDPHHVNSDRRAKEIRIVLEHLKRYENIGKYTIDTDTDEYLNNFEWNPHDVKKYTEDCKTLVFTKKFPFIKIEVKTVEKEDVITYTHDEKDKKLAKKHFRIHEHQRVLEEFHYKEFWRKIQRKHQDWWC